MPSAPRRVLMTADAVGGVWTYAMELARGLSAHGTQVLLAVMGGGVTDARRAAAEAIPNLTLADGPFRLEWMDDPWDDVARAGEWLRSLEAEFEPDVVHLNGYAHAALPWRAPVVSVAHSCVLSWFRAVRGEEAPVEWERYRATTSRGLHAADLVIAPSRAMLDEIRAIYRPATACRTIYNGRDADDFTPATKKPFILAAGRAWDEAKNFQLLAEAAARTAWPIYLAGDCGGRDFPGLRTLGVLAPGDMRAHYAEAAVFALPALYEPFGLSALEAALSGCALVLSDIPSLRELWDGAALFAPSRDPTSWSRTLNELASDAARREVWASRALDRGREFSSAAMIRNYLDAYEQAYLHRQNRLCASLSSATRSAPTGTTGTPIFSAA